MKESKEWCRSETEESDQVPHMISVLSASINISGFEAIHLFIVNACFSPGLSTSIPWNTVVPVGFNCFHNKKGSVDQMY